MAKRRSPRRKTAELAFEALSIEGGLLSPEWLAKAAQVQAGGQTEADYRVPKGLNLRDDIGRYWRVAQALWREFAAGRAGGDTCALSEHFVRSLLREVFGFTSIAQIAPVVLADRTYPIGFSALGRRVPVVIASAGEGIERSSTAFGEDGRRRTAFGLCQEYLNAADEALWGIVSDGVVLRVLRDNASLTRPAWIEGDLQRIFSEERFADFVALWLLIHETRFGREDQPATECALEAWRTAGQEEGTRARAQLRRGVERAIEALGQGFLVHPENQALRTALQDGSLTTIAYFQQLLRTVYRLIFLLTVEERGLLHPDASPSTERARRLYAEGYGMRRLRDRSVRRSAHDRFADLWESTKIVFRGVATGEPGLALPALAGIFAINQCPALDAAKVPNSALLLAVFRLSWLREDASLVRVNWRDMGPEELGSVYESLLELTPQITADGRQFAFATGGEAKGNARKTSGSYYTPDSLVQVLLDSALEPVIADTIAKNPAKPVEGLLALSIVDPACGSGHFLLAAARRLAAHVAKLQANGTPSAGEYRHALRQVVGHCIYGVDLNPLAVELCKVSLWMEAVEPGLPLTFLNSHVQHGNALLGATPNLLAKGIPDAAWEPIEGDDKKTASALKRRNKAERTTPNLSFEFSALAEGATLGIVSRVQALDAQPDLQASDVERKETTWRELLASELFSSRRLAADAWCAAFVWCKKPGELASIAPTHSVWENLRHAPESAPQKLVEEVERLAVEYRFFHWHLQFPQVFAKGGFDVLLGNPPWERMKIEEQEFFASRSVAIARAPDAATRKALIGSLEKEEPPLWREWTAARRQAEGESQFVRSSGRFPLCGKGDVNTYALFAENNRGFFRLAGRAGFIVPSGIATDDSTKEFFGSIIESRQLVSLYDFQSGPGLFGDVGHARFKFALMTLGQGVDDSALVFFARSTSELNDPRRRVVLSARDFMRLNPNTRTCPTFRSARDARITKEIYERHPILLRDDGESGPVLNPWALTIRRYLDMNKPETLALCAAKREVGHEIAVLEAKLIHQFEHRFGDYAFKKAGAAGSSLPDVALSDLRDPSYVVQPRYWISDKAVAERLSPTWTRPWLVVWRDICRSFDERTVIAAIVPFGGTDFTLRVASLGDPSSAPELVATLNSFVFDFVARQKLGGTHLSDYITKQLPSPLPERFRTPSVPWLSDSPLREWILPRVLELTYTAWDLEPFARDVGYHGPPFRWDGERRFVLRCELDAAFFHLFGLSRDDTDYVMDTFPIVRKHEEKVHGEYRTKRVILELYDAMAEASRTGTRFQTTLSPAAADLRAAHSRRAVPLESIPSGSWERPQQNPEAEAAAVLAAILKTFGRATPIREVRLAGIAALEPRLLSAALSKEEAATWRRLIGDEADPMRKGMVSFIPNADRAWGAAVKQLRGTGLLLEDGDMKTWAPGTNVGAIETSGWPDGRAGMVVQALRSRGVGEILKHMSAEARTWVDAAAA